MRIEVYISIPVIQVIYSINREVNINITTCLSNSYKFISFASEVDEISLKVIRHVFGFGIEFFENKDIDIFGHFIVIDFIKRYNYHAYFSPFSTS